MKKLKTFDHTEKIRETPDVWKEFIDYTRKIVRNDKINASDYNNMVTQWADKMWVVNRLKWRLWC